MIWASITTYASSAGCATLSYLAGDTVSISGINSTGTNSNVINSAPDAWMSITRVGN
jgi:hypothetical protein